MDRDVEIMSIILDVLKFFVHFVQLKMKRKINTLRYNYLENDVLRPPSARPAGKKRIGWLWGNGK